MITALQKIKDLCAKVDKMFAVVAEIDIILESKGLEEKEREEIICALEDLEGTLNDLNGCISTAIYKEVDLRQCGIAEYK